MFKLWKISLEILLTTKINKIRKVININKKIIMICYILFTIIKEMFYKLSYMLLFIMIIFIFDKQTSLSTFIFITLCSSVFDSILFNKSEMKKIMFSNFKSNKNYLLLNYYQTIITELIFLLPGILLYSYLINHSSIQLLLYIYSAKTLFNMLMLYIFKKYNYLFNGDEITKLSIIILITLLTLLLVVVYFKIGLSILINLINITLPISTIYLIKYPKYFRIITKNNYYLADYNIKEKMVIKNRKVEEYAASASYLNHIFSKRYYKYYIFYIIRGLVINIILLFMLTIKSIDSLISAIVIITYLSNPNAKLNDLYYYKCDIFLNNNLDKKQLYQKRLLDLILIGILINIPLLIYLLKKGITIGFILVILLIILYSIIYLNMLMVNNIYENNLKNIKYYLYRIINLGLIIILDVFLVSRYIIYISVIILLTYHIFIVKKYNV